MSKVDIFSSSKGQRNFSQAVTRYHRDSWKSLLSRGLIKIARKPSGTIKARPWQPIVVTMFDEASFLANEKIGLNSVQRRTHNPLLSRATLLCEFFYDTKPDGVYIKLSKWAPRVLL